MKRTFNIFSLAVILSLMVNLVGMPVRIARAADAGSLVVTGRNVAIANGDATPDAADDTDFGSFNVNWTSPICHYFTVKNNGATTLTVSVSGPTSGEFQWPIIMGSGVIPAGGSTLLRVCFRASTTGVKTATITLNTDDPLNPTFSFDVTGNGTNSYAPSEDDTSVYMLGSVATKVVFVDGPTYNWAGVTGSLTKSGIETSYVDVGLNSLESWAPPQAQLNFVREASTTVTIASDPYDAAFSGDDSTWLNQAFDQLGATGYGEVDRGRQYANDLRLRNHTDWGYTVFVILQPAGGSYVPWASEGGPYIVIPYAINSSSGVSPYGVAHETAHVFGANDDAYSCDYNGRFGYMGARTVNCWNNPNGRPFGTATLMNYGSGAPDPATGEELGWWELYYGSYPPVPPTVINSATPPPLQTLPTVSGLSPQGTTTNTTLIYTGGIASDQSAVPHYNATCTFPNYFCYPRDVNINTIASVQYHVDGGVYTSTITGDGTFDSDYEYFSFTTPALSVGQHTIEVRVTSSS